MEIVRIALLPEDIQDSLSYAEGSQDHTTRKLEWQRSRYSDIKRNITVGRIARNGVARALEDAGIACQFEDTPATKWKKFSIATSTGHFIQPHFIGDYPRHKMLPEDVRSFETRFHEFYVATASSDPFRHLDILGYATRSEMGQHKPKSFGQGVRNYYVFLDRLHPFKELVALLLASHGAIPRPVLPAMTHK